MWRSAIFWHLLLALLGLASISAAVAWLFGTGWFLAAFGVALLVVSAYIKRGLNGQATDAG